MPTVQRERSWCDAFPEKFELLQLYTSSTPFRHESLRHDRALVLAHIFGASDATDSRRCACRTPDCGPELKPELQRRPDPRTENARPTGVTPDPPDPHGSPPLRYFHGTKRPRVHTSLFEATRTAAKRWGSGLDSPLAAPQTGYTWSDAAGSSFCAPQQLPPAGGATRPVVTRSFRPPEMMPRPHSQHSSAPARRAVAPHLQNAPSPAVSLQSHSSRMMLSMRRVVPTLTAMDARAASWAPRAAVALVVS